MATMRSILAEMVTPGRLSPRGWKVKMYLHRYQEQEEGR